jgi:hypothetical protein
LPAGFAEPPASAQECPLHKTKVAFHIMEIMEPAHAGLDCFQKFRLQVFPIDA